MTKQLTKEMILSRIVKDEYVQMGRKTTVCLLTLKNGFEVVGTSACVNPDTFDTDLGRKYAFEEALERVWELEGYHLQAQFLTVNSDTEKDEKSIAAEFTSDKEWSEWHAHRQHLQSRLDRLEAKALAFLGRKAQNRAKTRLAHSLAMEVVSPIVELQLLHEDGEDVGRLGLKKECQILRKELSHREYLMNQIIFYMG